MPPHMVNLDEISHDLDTPTRTHVHTNAYIFHLFYGMHHKSKMKIVFNEK